MQAPIPQLKEGAFPRFVDGMTGEEYIAALADGNPGAVDAIVNMVSITQKAFPNAPGGALCGVLLLDDFGIYGPDIWRLFKDWSDRNPVYMLGILTLAKVGLLKIDLDAKGPNLDNLLEAVREVIPEFAGLH
jgi:hypothetical protein